MGHHIQKLILIYCIPSYYQLFYQISRTGLPKSQSSQQAPAPVSQCQQRLLWWAQSNLCILCPAHTLEFKILNILSATPSNAGAFSTVYSNTQKPCSAFLGTVVSKSKKTISSKTSISNSILHRNSLASPTGLTRKMILLTSSSPMVARGSGTDPWPNLAQIKN